MRMIGQGRALRLKQRGNEERMSVELDGPDVTGKVTSPDCSTSAHASGEMTGSIAPASSSACAGFVTPQMAAAYSMSAC